ncbi:MAG: hypothetical protein DMD59_13330 [Gemmatimonadetes bacterium]|nr:MAG: hypothetical protein DMD59_13330 [Gemmatimonadota bacterium]
MFGLQLDLLIPLILILIVVVVLVATKANVLPKKSLPFIAAGLAGVFGWSIFNKARKDALRQKLKDEEAQQREQEKRAAEAARLAGISDGERMRAVAEAQRLRDAQQKERLLIDARTAQEKEEISKLQGDELWERYLRQFGQDK